MERKDRNETRKLERKKKKEKPSPVFVSARALQKSGKNSQNKGKIAIKLAGRFVRIQAKATADGSGEHRGVKKKKKTGEERHGENREKM